MEEGDGGHDDVGRRGGEPPPQLARDAVLVRSKRVGEHWPVVRGHEFGDGGGGANGHDKTSAPAVDYDALLRSYMTTGFQATQFGRAVQIVNEMLAWRPSKEQVQSGEMSADERCTIFLGFTSNLISSGVRDIVRFLVENSMVDVVVTSAGGVEEDLIKCLADTYVADFRLDGAQLRSSGLNRIGNLVVPNDNYCAFEDWLTPKLDAAVDEQTQRHVLWTPSRLIRWLGEQLNDDRSVCTWASRNNVPIFSPALTDGSLGDMIYFHSFRRPGLVVDIVEDIRAVNRAATRAKRTGMIILGGGVVKHHICNANLMRNGADYAVYINTAQEFDGSDAGASPDEATSWGKIRADARSVKLCADATLVFPLLVAQSFAKHRRR